MRIKLFEGFNQDEYYVEINDIEWESFTPLMITKSTIDKINKIIPCQIMDDYTEGNFNYLKWTKRKHTSMFSALGFDTRLIISISIFEAEDEYFYVNYNIQKSTKSTIRLYKCDQIDGLKKLLKDIGIID